MASLGQKFTRLRCSPLSSSSRLSRRAAKNLPQNKSGSVPRTIVVAVAMSSGQTRERLEHKKMFEDAYERCRTAPMESVAFTVDDFAAAIEQYDFNSEIGTRVRLCSGEMNSVQDRRKWCLGRHIDQLIGLLVGRAGVHP